MDSIGPTAARSNLLKITQKANVEPGAGQVPASLAQEGNRVWMKRRCHNACGNHWISIHELPGGLFVGRDEYYKAKCLVERLLGTAGQNYLALLCSLLQAFKVLCDQGIVLLCPGLWVMQSRCQMQNVKVLPVRLSFLR